jgi:type III secretion protein J
MWRAEKWGVLGAVALWVGAAGCAVPVAGGLEESDANRIVVALDRAIIDATKEADPSVEGKFRVTVPRDDTARALSVMRSEDLPRPRQLGVMDAIDKGALVPSAAQEHAQIVAGTAGDLARTLEGVDGVLSARVHLNVAVPDPLRNGPLPRTTASVLLEHRGSTPPLTEVDVARLVAGGVPGLAVTDVAVVFVSHAAVPAQPHGALQHVGPFALLASSARLHQLLLVSTLLLLAGMTALALWLSGRVRRLQREVLAVASGRQG